MSRSTPVRPVASMRVAPKCARCHRKIKPGNERLFQGRYYGSECVERVIDAANASQPSTQEDIFEEDLTDNAVPS